MNYIDKVLEGIQKDLDNGKFNLICSNESAFKAYIKQSLLTILKEIKAEAMGEIDKSDNPVRRAGYNAHREHVRKVFDKLIN